MLRRTRTSLPGFRLSLTFTMSYLGLLIVVPLAACFAKSASLPFDKFWGTVTTERALAAYSFTLGASLAAAITSSIIGFIVAWVLVRYDFPLKRFFDAIVDLPFALPTAVAGLVYSSLYAQTGWLGQVLVPLGINAAYSRLAVVLVLTFVGFPFVVRAIQPVLEDMDRDMEEAAYLMGARRWQTITRVIVPSVLPSLTTGFALAFARGLGEYGSVVFVSGNMPYRTEIAPVLVVARLEEFAYAEATAIAVVLLSLSLVTLILINLLERWSGRHVR